MLNVIMNSKEGLSMHLPFVKTSSVMEMENKKTKK
jgi:hypothetical protein